MVNNKSPLPLINIKDVLPKDPSEMKCGPHLNFENGSCIPLKLLVEMSEAYNKYANKYELKDKIILYENNDDKYYKLYLLKEFKNRFNKNHKEWLQEKFIELMNEDSKNELINNTFRPKGPQGNFEWLSTIDINLVLEQYQQKYQDFRFLGAVPIDFNDLSYLPFQKLNFDDLLKNGINRIGVIFNLDESYKSGSHWVSLFINLEEGKVYFSDSYGIKPENRIQDFINKIVEYFKNKNYKDIDNRFNKTQHQQGNSECGVYSINFILRLLKGKSFDHVTRKRLKDEKINKCRRIYFN